MTNNIESRRLNDLGFTCNMELCRYGEPWVELHVADKEEYGHWVCYFKHKFESHEEYYKDLSEREDARARMMIYIEKKYIRKEMLKCLKFMKYQKKNLWNLN